MIPKAERVFIRQPLLHPYHKCYKKTSAAGNLLWLYNIWAWNYIFSFTMSDWYPDWCLLTLYRCLTAFNPIAQSSLSLANQNHYCSTLVFGEKKKEKLQTLIQHSVNQTWNFRITEEADLFARQQAHSSLTCTPSSSTGPSSSLMTPPVCSPTPFPLGCRLRASVHMWSPFHSWAALQAHTVGAAAL